MIPLCLESCHHQSPRQCPGERRPAPATEKKPLFLEKVQLKQVHCNLSRTLFAWIGMLHHYFYIFPIQACLFLFLFKNKNKLSNKGKREELTNQKLGLLWHGLFGCWTLQLEVINTQYPVILFKNSKWSDLVTSSNCISYYISCPAHMCLGVISLSKGSFSNWEKIRPRNGRGSLSFLCTLSMRLWQYVDA
jgi:hypothetical protein